MAPDAVALRLLVNLHVLVGERASRRPRPTTAPRRSRSRTGRERAGGSRSTRERGSAIPPARSATDLRFADRQPPPRSGVGRRARRPSGRRRTPASIGRRSQKVRSQRGKHPGRPRRPPHNREGRASGSGWAGRRLFLFSLPPAARKAVPVGASDVLAKVLQHLPSIRPGLHHQPRDADGEVFVVVHGRRPPKHRVGAGKHGLRVTGCAERLRGVGSQGQNVHGIHDPFPFTDPPTRRPPETRPHRAPSSSCRAGAATALRCRRAERAYHGRASCLLVNANASLACNQAAGTPSPPLAIATTPPTMAQVVSLSPSPETVAHRASS